MNSNFFLRYINKKILFILFFVFTVFFTNTAFAASLNLSPSSGSYKVGDTIKVRIVLSSLDQSANAVSGTISYTKELLSLDSISKAGSVVGLWAVEPSYSNSAGTANMEGVILSGYSGSNGTVATLSFKVKAIGNANVKLTNSSVLANDGQGTNILSSMGQANFTIIKAVEKIAPIVLENTNKVVSNIQIQELSRKGETDSSITRFLITASGKQTKSLYKIEIDGVGYSWADQDSNIFETPILPKGNYVLKVSMDTINNETIFNTVSFSVDNLLIPVFSEYSENIKEKEYIIAKGVADSNVNIIIRVEAILADTNQKTDQEIIIKSDEKGLFNYVSEKSPAGVYKITAYSRTKSGTESAKSLPITINVLPFSEPITTSIMNTFSAIIPVVALIILLVILSIWGWYKVLHYKENMHKKLIRTKNLIAKSFDILDEDVTEEIKIFKKIKASEPLTNEERLFINQIKKDLESAERVITDNIK